MLLIGIMLPTVGRVRAQARLVKCIGNLRQMDAALKAPDDTGRPKTRLPAAEAWAGVVIDSAPGAAALLSCPDGPVRDDYGPLAARFDAWSGNGTGNPNGSRLQGKAWWRPTTSGSGDSFTTTWRLAGKGKPSDVLTVTFRRLRGNTWEATVVTKPAAMRVDARILTDGRRFVGIGPGFKIEYDGTSHGIDYAYNLMAGGSPDARMGKVLIMDYNYRNRDVKDVFDFDGFPLSAPDDDDAAETIPQDRHGGRVNALLSDGSVQTFDVDALRPTEPIYDISGVRGPNPGGTSVSTGGNNGGGNGGKGK